MEGVDGFARSGQNVALKTGGVLLNSAAGAVRLSPCRKSGKRETS
jgi:hypothetical protein